MHAEVEILVGRLIQEKTGQKAGSGSETYQKVDPDRRGDMNQRREGHQPPAKGYLVWLPITGDVAPVTMVHTMMDLCMTYEDVTKRSCRAVHDKPVENPFKEAGIDPGGDQGGCKDRNEQGSPPLPDG